jgi:hypothetical protein
LINRERKSESLSVDVADVNSPSCVKRILIAFARGRDADVIFGGRWVWEGWLYNDRGELPGYGFDLWVTIIVMFIFPGKLVGSALNTRSTPDYTR